jgi:hypothetical protein
MYFPKSQIQTNLYTNGNEFQKITTKEIYTGFYFKTSTGQFYTGKTPNDGPNTQLVKVSNVTDPGFVTSSQYEFYNQNKTITNVFSNVGIDLDVTSINNDYYSLKNVSYRNSLTRKIPISFSPIPTEKEYEIGVFQRYFCKKNNELVYIETNQENYNLLINRSSNIAWDLYSALPVLWYIKGNIEDVYKINKNLISLIEMKNKWHGFTQYFKDDFTKYTLEA